MTQKNPTLEKNLACIAKYNPNLVKALRELPYLTHDIQLIETDLKEPNLAYDRLPLHSQAGAEKEARDVFARTKNTPLSMHVLFGIGLGHLFQVFCQNSKGIVLVFEPNLEILRVTLELVDFSKELSQRNVRLYSDIQSFREGFVGSYQYKAQVTFTFLGSYKQIYADSINDFFKQLEKIMGGCISDYNTLRDSATQSVTMIVDNLNYIMDEVPLMEFRDIYKGKTALIVSAGPSLDRDIETIKKNRDKVVIFCVGTAYKALASKGIVPDFLNLIEIYDCSGQVKDFDLSEVNLILEPYTNTSIHKLSVKKKLLFPTNSSHANVFWSNLTGVDLTPYVSKGTVSYQALASAKMLGCKKVILVGQDLAFAGNKCYSEGSAYSDLGLEINPETKMPEFKVKDKAAYIKSLLPVGVSESTPEWEEYVKHKIKNLEETLYFVKGTSGETLPTQGGYAAFIEYFREFAYLNQDLELINSSMIGAQIDGFKNIPLEEALKGESEFERVSLDKKFKYDKKRITANLEIELKKLTTILDELLNPISFLYKYETAISNGTRFSEQGNEYFKMLVVFFDQITREYYNKNPLYQAIVFSETIEPQYYIKETEVVDNERIEMTYRMLNYYFLSTQMKLKSICSKMTELISEMKMSQS